MKIHWNILKLRGRMTKIRFDFDFRYDHRFKKNKSRPTCYNFAQKTFKLSDDWMQNYIFYFTWLKSQTWNFHTTESTDTESTDRCQWIRSCENLICDNFWMKIANFWMEMSRHTDDETWWRVALMNNSVSSKKLKLHTW